MQLSSGFANIEKWKIRVEAEKIQNEKEKKMTAIIQKASLIRESKNNTSKEGSKSFDESNVKIVNQSFDTFVQKWNDLENLATTS